MLHLPMPWPMLFDQSLERLDLAVYAALSRFVTASPVVLGATVGDNVIPVIRALHRLRRGGWVHRAEGNSWTVVLWRRIAETALVSAQVRNSQTLSVSGNTEGEGDKGGEKKGLVREKGRGQRGERETAAIVLNNNQLSMRNKALRALETVRNREAGWGPLALLGLFHEKYQAHYSIVYRSNNQDADYRHIELMVQHAGGLSEDHTYIRAVWFIEALFSKHMAWVKSKTLDFLSSADKVSRFIAPAAQLLSEEQVHKAEWQPQSAPQAGVVFDPTKR